MQNHNRNNVTKNQEIKTVMQQKLCFMTTVKTMASNSIGRYSFKKSKATLLVNGHEVKMPTGSNISCSETKYCQN